jgi:hypothetical protein
MNREPGRQHREQIIDTAFKLLLQRMGNFSYGTSPTRWA